ncbi:MAG: ATP-binding protein [Desulfomonilaceae bacterium]
MIPTGLMVKTDYVDKNPDLAAMPGLLRSWQIRQVYSNSLVGGLAALLGGIVFAWALWGTISHYRLIVWISCYMAIFVVRLLLISAYRKAAPTGKELFTWGTRHTLVTTLSGLVWTTAAVFIFPEDSAYLQIFMIIFVGGIVAGAVVVYSATNEYLINILLVLMPLSGRFIYQGEDFDLRIGVILFLFGGFMALLGHSIHKLYAEFLTLRFEKDDLIEQLRADISWRDQSFSLTERLRVDAEIANAAKNEFLTNMSHELRTPLTAIIGFSELLAGRFFGELNEKQISYVQEIFDSGHQLLKLINDILDLSRIETGKADLNISAVDLNQLLNNCIGMIKERSIRRNLTLELQIKEDDFFGKEILADELRLKQIVVNLLSNATKFSPVGGHVRLEAQRNGHELMISVSDTGIGIKPEDQDRIYEVFERLNFSFSRPEPGTGLGLALVRKLVELHGGRVWVESEGEGKGSTFRFVIPYLESGKEEQENEPLKDRNDTIDGSIQAIVMARKKHPRVLVVEDNGPNIRLITNLLEAGGYEPLLAFSAEEGIKVAERENPSVILMDISLPGMNGLAATRALKENPATAQIPVIALTAHAMKDDETRVREAGCDAYILKPVDTEIFNATISKLIK